MDDACNAVFNAEYKAQGGSRCCREAAPGCHDAHPAKGPTEHGANRPGAGAALKNRRRAVQMVSLRSLSAWLAEVVYVMK